MSHAAGFSVRIFIPSGEPEGLRIVEKSNWTGQGLVFPRSQFIDARKRTEIQRTGVYVLWGPGEAGGGVLRVYVGEGDGVLARLDQHNRTKDFWTHAVVFTSKDQNLNKAHVQYLEAQLVRRAAEAKRCELDNSNVPQPPALSEADTADAESFLADLLLCLPLVGVTFFDQPTEEAIAHQRFLFLKSRDITARGYDEAEGFIVLSGSLAAKIEVPSIPTHLSDLRRLLVSQGVLMEDGDFYRLAQAYTFNSPSTAAGVILGRSVNGRDFWKDSDGRSLKDIQMAEAAEAHD